MYIKSSYKLYTMVHVNYISINLGKKVKKRLQNSIKEENQF